MPKTVQNERIGIVKVRIVHGGPDCESRREVLDEVADGPTVPEFLEACVDAGAAIHASKKSPAFVQKEGRRIAARALSLLSHLRACPGEEHESVVFRGLQLGRSIERMEALGILEAQGRKGSSTSNATRKITSERRKVEYRSKVEQMLQDPRYQRVSHREICERVGRKLDPPLSGRWVSERTRDLRKAFRGK